MGFTNLAEMPGHVIRRLNQRSTAVFQDRLRAAGQDLTSVQFAALETLARHDGIDQAGLAGLIAYDRATIGGVVKRLEQKGLVERGIDENDRRSRALRLTVAGRQVLAEITPVVIGLQAEILGNLSREEAVQFMELSRKALGGLGET